MNLKSIPKACLIFLLLVSALTPAKVGLGQGFKYVSQIRGWNLNLNGGGNPPVINRGINNGIIISYYPNVLLLGQDGSFRAEFQVPSSPHLSLSVAQGSDGAIVTLNGQTVSKYSSTGTFLWSCQLTSSVQCEGFDISPDGRIYISDSWGEKVWVVSSDGVNISFFTSNQLNKPCNIRCLPDGSLLVQSAWHTDAANTTTYTNLFTASGDYVRRYNPGSIPHMLYRGIDLDESGNLWCLDSGALWSYDVLGNWRGFSDGTIWPGPTYDWSMFYQNGKVFSTSSILGGSTSSIKVFDISSDTHTYISPFGFNRPRSIVQHSNGDYYVADTNNSRVMCIGSEGRFKFSFGSPGSSDGQFLSPSVITTNALNHLVIGEIGSARIQEFDTLGNHVKTISYDTVGSTASIVIKSNGDLLVADELSNRLLLCDSNGLRKSMVGGYGTGPQQYQGIAQIAVDVTGKVFVIDSGNNRVHVYDENLNQIDIWGTAGSSTGQLNSPKSIVVDRETIVLGDTNRIQRFLPDGTFLSAEGISGLGSSQFGGAPSSVVINVNKQIVVVDSDNARFLIYERKDQTPATSNFSASPSTTWSNSDVTATIASTDNAGGSGVKEVHYSVNMGTEQVITGSSATFTLSENGTHSIGYWSVDNAGNTETTNYATVRIDKTRPTVDAYVIASLVTVVAQDTVSGVASTKVSIDGAAAVNYTGSFTVAPGAHTVTYWATDLAGNESTREVVLVGVSVASVAVSPTTLFATKAGVGTVKLSLAAPAGGVVVMLESNSPAVSVPVSVTVPSGASSATFPVTAGTVSTDTKAVVTASVGGQEVHGTVYVLVPFPKTLTVSPTTIIGGDAGIGTVALASNAGVGGQVVNLTSSNVNVVVPATVTVPAGATSAKFPVQTSIISSDIAVAISADADGSGITTTVLIKRVAPKSITFAPSSVVGGNSSVATLTVTKPAPTGGIVIDLRSVSSNVSVPSTVTIAAGATTATFPVTTVPVKKSESAMIQAYAAGVKVSAVITVTATSVVSVSLNPTTVVGGLNSTATVTLNGVAPVGGTTIQLYSTNVAASVPTSVVVPAGSKTVTFPVTTVVVAANTTASIAVKYLGTTKSAALTIAAPTVSTLTLAPSSLTGGSTSKLTIKLSGKAATGGVVVTLTSSNTVVAQLPTSVTIPAGSDTVDVTVQTGAVAVTTNVTITAKTGAVAKTAVLTVNK